VCDAIGDHVPCYGDQDAQPPEQEQDNVDCRPEDVVFDDYVTINHIWEVF
jgi:hypothetical protein